MPDRILIAGLKELGVHGVLPEEQTRPQPFQIDLELFVNATDAGRSDELEDTVDYSAVCEAVSRVVRSESYRLLERLATRIAEVCRSDRRGVAGVVEGIRGPADESGDSRTAGDATASGASGTMSGDDTATAGSGLLSTPCSVPYSGNRSSKDIDSSKTIRR